MTENAGNVHRAKALKQGDATSHLRVTSLTLKGACQCFQSPSPPATWKQMRAVMTSTGCRATWTTQCGKALCKLHSHTRASLTTFVKCFVLFSNKSKIEGEIFKHHHMGNALKFLWVMTMNRDGVLLITTGEAKKRRWGQEDPNGGVAGGVSQLLASQEGLRCSGETRPVFSPCCSEAHPAFSEQLASRDFLTPGSSGSFPPWKMAHVVHLGTVHAGMLHTRAREKALDWGPEVSGSSSGCVTCYFVNGQGTRSSPPCFPHLQKWK